MFDSIAEPKQIVEPQPRNRLTIGFLMLWTVGTAVILAFHRAVNDSQPQSTQARAYSLYMICYALLYGPAIASVMLFIQRKIAKVGGFPIQPGHWLLLIRGLTTVVWLAGWTSRVLIERFLDSSHFTSTLYLAMQFLPAVAVSYAGYTIALRQNRDAGRVWRLALRLMQFNAGIGLVIAVFVLAFQPFNSQMLPYTFTSFFYPAIFVVLIVALATDRESKSRDFLHWAGVISALVTTVLPNLYRLLVWLLN